MENESVPVLEEIRTFWDADASTYNNSRGHSARSPAVSAAWTATLAHLLPSARSRILDVGAGTGFLSLIAARLGHDVTALDLSPKMLDALDAACRREGLHIEIVVGSAEEPPVGFDAVMERHLLWTLPDPALALGAWRRAAPNGRLVLVESLWGRVDPVEKIRASARHGLRRMRGEPPDHHGTYSESLRRTLPLATGTAPSRLVELAGQQGWRRPRLERLRDIEWAERCELPIPERIVGEPPRFAVLAD